MHLVLAFGFEGVGGVGRGGYRNVVLQGRDVVKVKKNEYIDEGGSPKTGMGAYVQRALFLARRAALSFRPLLLGSRSPTLKCRRSVVATASRLPRLISSFSSSPRLPFLSSFPSSLPLFLLFSLPPSLYDEDNTACPTLVLLPNPARSAAASSHSYRSWRGLLPSPPRSSSPAAPTAEEALAV